MTSVCVHARAFMCVIVCTLQTHGGSPSKYVQRIVSRAFHLPRRTHSIRSAETQRPNDMPDRESEHFKSTIIVPNQLNCENNNCAQSGAQRGDNGKYWEHLRLLQGGFGGSFSRPRGGCIAVTVQDPNWPLLALSWLHSSP